MSAWQQRPSSSAQDDHEPMDPASYPPNNSGNPYSNVPSSPQYSPSPTHENLRPVATGNAVSPATSAAVRASSYVPSPLNPNATSSRSRPVSWGGNHGLDKLSTESRAEGSGSAKSSNSSGERETLRGIISGTVGGGFGPYSVGVSLSLHSRHVFQSHRSFSLAPKSLTFYATEPPQSLLNPLQCWLCHLPILRFQVPRWNLRSCPRWHYPFHWCFPTLLR